VPRRCGGGGSALCRDSGIDAGKGSLETID
jgi:hypothetical protein